MCVSWKGIIFNYFKGEINDGSDDNLKVVNITVEEKPTGEVSAGAGVGTNGGSFAIMVKENNWLGKGVQLSAQAEVREDSLKGSLTYSDPDFNFSGRELIEGSNAYIFDLE